MTHYLSNGDELALYKATLDPIYAKLKDVEAELREAKQLILDHGDFERAADLALVEESLVVGLEYLENAIPNFGKAAT